MVGISFLIGAETTLEPPLAMDVEGRGAAEPPDARASNRCLSELTATTSSSSVGDDVDSLGDMLTRSQSGRVGKSCGKMLNNEAGQAGGELKAARFDGEGRKGRAPSLRAFQQSQNEADGHVPFLK